MTFHLGTNGLTRVVCGGNSQSYANGDWTGTVATPNAELFSGVLQTGKEIVSHLVIQVRSISLICVCVCVCGRIFSLLPSATVPTATASIVVLHTRAGRALR